MRTALFSDIHGDLEALQAVLAGIERQKCDRILCLGDLVDGGEHSLKVVRLLSERSVLIVRGNHDENPSVPLPAEDVDFLRALPEQIVEGEVIYTHQSPPHKKRKVKDDFEVWNVFDDTFWRRIFIGDVHVPSIWGQKCEHPISATRYAIAYNEPFAFEARDRYLICVGSFARSRDGLDAPRYAIYDAQWDTVTFHAPAST